MALPNSDSYKTSQKLQVHFKFVILKTFKFSCITVFGDLKQICNRVYIILKFHSVIQTCVLFSCLAYIAWFCVTATTKTSLYLFVDKLGDPFIYQQRYC